MKLRLRVLALMLLSAVAALAPLAYATPPDPTWIDGFWDESDHDDVIFLITSDVGAVEPNLIRDGNPVQAVVSTLRLTDERSAFPSAVSSPSPRAPPVRRCSV